MKDHHTHSGIIVISMMTRRFLVVEHPEGHIGFVKGKIESSDLSPRHAALRELKEETCIDSLNLHILDIDPITETYTTVDGENKSVIYFAAFVVDEGSVKGSGGTLRSLWVSVEEIENSLNFPRSQAISKYVKLMEQREISIEYRPGVSKNLAKPESVQLLAQNLSKHQYSRLAPLSLLFPDLFLFASKPDTVDSAYIERVRELSRQVNKGIISIPPHITDNSWSTLNLIPALLRKHGGVRLSKPQGCKIGERPIEWYLDVCRSFGCVVVETDDNITIETGMGDTPKKDNIYLDFQKPTFTGTSMALAFAAWQAIDYKLTTTIVNASQEPEIRDMINAMRRLGYRIDEGNSDQVYTLSVFPLEAKLNTVIWEVALDRNVLFTYLCGIILTSKQITFDVNQNASIDEAIPLFNILNYNLYSDSRCIRLTPRSSLDNMQTAKEVHFGFAPMPGSDWQPLFSTTAAALGMSLRIYDHVFEDRFKYLESVRNIMKNITVKHMADGSVTIDRVASIRKDISPTSVRAGDLRYGAAMLLACLSTDRKVIITNIHQIFRGYANPVELFNSTSNRGTFHYVQH